MTGNPFDFTTADFMTIYPGNPAAGSQMSFLVPVKAIIMPVAIQLRFVSDATATSRVVVVGGHDGIEDFGLTPAPGIQTASSSRLYHASINSVPLDWTAPMGDQFFNIMSPMYLRFGDSFVTQIHSLQAGDQIQDIIFRYHQWIVD